MKLQPALLSRFLATMLVALIQLPINGSAAAAQQLRHGRGLQVTTLVPFGATIKIGKGSANMNVVPTLADNNWVAEAVMDWFDANSQATSEFSSNGFVGTDCTVQSTSGINGDPSYQHQVSLDCTANFQGNTAPPSAYELIQTAAKYSVNNFISRYLNPAVSASSAYNNPRSVLLGLVYVSTTASTTTTTTTTTAGSHTGTTSTSTTTTTSSTTTTPAAPVIPTDPVFNETITLEWKLGRPANQAVALREPTNAEWDQLVLDTHSFVERTLDTIYNALDTEGQLPEFMGLQGPTQVLSKLYSYYNALRDCSGIDCYFPYHSRNRPTTHVAMGLGITIGRIGCFS